MDDIDKKKHQLFYIHGGEAFSDYKKYLKHLETVEIEPPTEDSERSLIWTDSLRTELGEDWEVFKPTMPNKLNARYKEWKIWFERHFEFLRDDVVLLGWSQGGYFLAKYLIENQTPFKVKALFLVAAPFEPADFGGEDGGDFAFNTKKVGQLAKRAETIHIFHSEDDPVVPFEHARLYHEGIKDSVLLSFTSRGHFVVEEFPELVEKIKGVFKSPETKG